MRLEQWQEHWGHTLKEYYPEQETRSLLVMALAHRMNFSAVDLVTQKEFDISPGDLDWLDSVMKRLLNKEPIQQIIGFTWFCDQQFFVNSDVLIPRPETEELVMSLRQKLQHSQVQTALDIGTGSGCIALCLAAAIPQTQWYAWDVSPQALALAQKNQQQFISQVNWQCQDALGSWPDQHFDLIVSNPPYIPEEEQKSMDQNVINFEPHLALFVPSNDPLKFYRAISSKGFDHLNSGGQLYFECHYKYTQAVAQLMKTIGFDKVDPWKDQWGKWRFVSGVRP